MTSMTGHGRGEARAAGWTAVVECFSVNRKNAEVVCHAERGATWLEPAVRERVLARIARGRVQVNLTLDHADGASVRVLDAARAAAFVREARALQKTLKLPGEMTISDVLLAPGVARSQEPAGDGAKKATLAALDSALDGLAATREREGAALKKVLLKSAKTVAALAKKISPLAAATSTLQRDAMLGRIAQAGIDVRTDDPRLLTEVALLAERGDVTEELHRAASHIDQFLEKLSAEGPVGRTLEFLTQELGREFNTLGSKSANTAISRLVIDAKAELDRIREQLANIE